MSESPRPVPAISRSGLCLPSWRWACWNGQIVYPKHIVGCVPIFELINIDVEAEEQQVELGIIEKPARLTIRADALELEDFTTTMVVDVTGWISFHPPLHNLYKANSKEAWFMRWIAFDGKRQKNIRFDKVLCAFISSYTEKEAVYNEEGSFIGEGDRQIWYFLLLLKFDGNSQWYKRVGIGATKDDSWRESVYNRIVNIE